MIKVTFHKCHKTNLLIFVTVKKKLKSTAIPLSIKKTQVVCLEKKQKQKTASACEQRFAFQY